MDEPEAVAVEQSIFAVAAFNDKDEVVPLSMSTAEAGSRGTLARESEHAQTAPSDGVQQRLDGSVGDTEDTPVQNSSSSLADGAGVKTTITTHADQLNPSCTNNDIVEEHGQEKVDELANGSDPRTTAEGKDENAMGVAEVSRNDRRPGEERTAQDSELTPLLPMVSFVAPPAVATDTKARDADEHGDDPPPVLLRSDVASDPPNLSSISGLQVSAYNESSVFRSTTSGKSATLERSTPRKPLISIREDDAVPNVPLPALASGPADRRIAGNAHASSHTSRAATDALPGDDTEQGIRRRIELLSNELTARLSPVKHLASPPRLVSDVVGSLNTTQQMSATTNLVSPAHRAGSGNDDGLSTARRRVSLHGRAILQAHPTSATSQPDYRKMRDGIIAMSTAVRQTDFETIVQSREVKLSLLLDEKAVLKRRLHSLESDIELLAAQKADLEALRHNHHVDECRLKSEVSAVLQQINQLKWEETNLHTQITDLTTSLHRFRHKRSVDEMKLLEELNAVSYELSTLEKSVADEKAAYATERQRLRLELRALQEEIVEFKPAQWLASAMVTSKAKLLGQQLGDDRRAQQFLSPALALADRRKTIAHIEAVRGALDSFLGGVGSGGSAAAPHRLATV